MKDFSLHSDEELMREIKADNMYAFDALYGKYCKRVYRFGYSILKTREEAENLMQEVFLNLWESRHKVEKDASIKSYIFTVTHNLAVSVIRKKSREYEFVEYLKSLQLINENPVNVQLEYNELTNRLKVIINALPQRQKEVYLMHKEEGLKYNEIAERLHISVNTIENHMSRALKTIRSKLDDYSLVIMLFVYLFV